MDFNPSEFTILIIDDIPTNVLLLKIILQKEGYHVETAESAKELFHILDQGKKPDLLLLDVMMPDMDGYQAAEIVRKRPDTAEIGIIFITALTGSNNIIEGFRKGGNDFISKPFNKEELLIKIKHQLSLTSATRLIQSENEKLQQTIRNRDVLYSIIAHDLRSPLGSLKMSLNTLSLLLSAEQIGPELMEMLQGANSTTEDLFCLLDNLLKWTKSLTGRLNVAFQDMDIVEQVNGIAQIFEIGAQQKGIKIVVSGAKSVMAHFDVDMIKTVLRNLLSNAIKFSNDNSTITILVETTDTRVIIHVSDQGVGIPLEKQEKLRAHESFTTFGTKNEEGSGLGLNLCRDFVSKNNGNFWFESIPDKGSTFSFDLEKIGN